MTALNNIFMALSDPTRRQIVQCLRKKDMTPSELLEQIEVTQPTLSHHLDILKRANLITGTKEGQFIHYAMNMTVLDMAIEFMMTTTTRRR
jgi:ArsR family transcriptional regulator, arsenate/arsenite/antimonite-responsive transcriptional repressor